MTTTGPIRLQRLELENFRGFEKLELDFEPDLTVLVGANGSGKSSLLEAVALAASDTARVNPIDWPPRGRFSGNPADLWRRSWSTSKREVSIAYQPLLEAWLERRLERAS